MVTETARNSSQSSILTFHQIPLQALDRYLNRDLPAGWRIELRSGWPFLFVPLLLFMQLLGPSPIWIALLVSLVGLYAISYAWVRNQIGQVHFERRREGAMLVVGDALQERFFVRNESSLPLHWLEFADRSRLPGYNPRQVVSCGGGSSYQWRAEAHCTQRGVFRLGPHTLRTADPFGLFSLEISDARSESLLVYPRVAHIPQLELPRGNLSGQDRRRRAYSGSERSQAVRAYRPGDSLRYVHWPISARQGELVVTDVETEPSGDLWIVLDVNRAVQSGEAESNTLETGVVLAASAAAEFLSGGERRSVGLLAATAADAIPQQNSVRFSAGSQEFTDSGPDGSDSDALNDFGMQDRRSSPASHLVDVPPQPGKGQVWRILAALAPVQPGDLSLAQLLRRSRGLFSAGQTVLVITSDIGEGVQDWTAELLHLRRGGVSASVLAVTPASPEESNDDHADEQDTETESPDDQPMTQLQGHLAAEVNANPFTSTDEAQANLIDVLTRHEIPVQFLQAGTRLAPALTYRRTRTILRTTPSGGVVAQEVEEVVG